jgi:hypothetical protein
MRQKSICSHERGGYPRFRTMSWMNVINDEQNSQVGNKVKTPKTAPVDDIPG